LTILVEYVIILVLKMREGMIMMDKEFLTGLAMMLFPFLVEIL
jgi:hypothetical protein